MQTLKELVNQGKVRYLGLSHCYTRTRTRAHTRTSTHTCTFSLS